MSKLKLFRGPPLRMVYQRGANQANDMATRSVLLVADQTVMMRAHPSDFPQLLAWLEGEAKALRAFMAPPAEDGKGVMEDLTNGQ